MTLGTDAPAEPRVTLYCDGTWELVNGGEDGSRAIVATAKHAAEEAAFGALDWDFIIQGANFPYDVESHEAVPDFAAFEGPGAAASHTAEGFISFCEFLRVVLEEVTYDAAAGCFAIVAQHAAAYMANAQAVEAFCRAVSVSLPAVRKGGSSTATGSSMRSVAQPLRLYACIAAKPPLGILRPVVCE